MIGFLRAAEYASLLNNGNQMKFRFSALATAMTIAISSTSVYADGTVDGNIGAAYGAAVSVQTVNTQFGDEDGAAGTDGPNGGELDAAYVTIIGDRLYIGITGNLETDSFNKLSLFIDSRSGGENTLSALPDYDFGNASSNLGLVSFAPGFEADFHLFGRAGGGNFEVDLVDRQGGTSVNVLSSSGSAVLSGDFGTALGTIGASTGNGTGVTGTAAAQPIDFALDNSNSAGVVGGSTAAVAADALAVTTGAEFSIALSDLGASPGDTISIVASYSNGDYNFFSNQFLGGLPAGTENLGADGGGNFEQDASAVALDLSGVAPFSITVPNTSVLKGDVDMDGDVDFDDIPAFIAVLQAGTFQAEADCDCSGGVDFADIPAFIAILQGQ